MGTVGHEKMMEKGWMEEISNISSVGGKSKSNRIELRCRSVTKINDKRQKVRQTSGLTDIVRYAYRQTDSYIRQQSDRQAISERD